MNCELLKLLLLDFDGTLADTRRANTLAYVETLREAGYDLTEEEYAANYFGMRCDEFLTRLGVADPSERERLRLRKIARYPAYFDTVRLNEPLWAFCRRFQRTGGKVWIVSTGSHDNITNVMHHLGIGLPEDEGGYHPEPGTPKDDRGPHPGIAAPEDERRHHPEPCTPEEDGKPHPDPAAPENDRGCRPGFGAPEDDGGLHPKPAAPEDDGGLHPEPGSPKNGRSCMASETADPAPLGRVDGMITGADVIHPKPAPDCFLEAMRRAGCTPAETLIFEDSPIGLEAARRSGASWIKVTL